MSSPDYRIRMVLQLIKSCTTNIDTPLCRSMFLNYSTSKVSPVRFFRTQEILTSGRGLDFRGCRSDEQYSPVITGKGSRRR